MAPTNGPVDFNTLGSDFDTTLAVYTGTIVTTLANIVANDDDQESGGLRTSRLWFNAVAGVTYRIAVDGFAGDFGNVQLNWNMESRLSIVNLPDGTVSINLTGVDWQRYTLMGTTNLLDWSTNVPTITMMGGTHTFTKDPSTNEPNQNFQLFRGVRNQ